MTERQQKILELIIKEYVESSKPVSSKLLTQKKIGLSSATLRNEMMELEKMNYLKQPHTSAGRIPTDKAYRFFIKSTQLKPMNIPVKISKKPSDNACKDIAQKLAEMSGAMAFSGIRELNSFYQSGFSNLFKFPEFEDKDFFAEAGEMMEEFENHFNELFNDINDNETRVFIGKENPLGRMKKISIIVSKCKMSDKKHGVIGLLGPTRMKYNYNISLINKLKEILENE